jgi:putative flippase GtrA
MTAARAHLVEFARFGFAGAVNTVFGFAVYAGLVVAGLPPAVALLVATIAGVFFNFVSFGRLAFRRLEAKRLPRFLAAYAVIYVANLALLESVRRLTPLGPIVAQLGCLAVIAPAAFLLLKTRVFQPASP